MPVLSGPKELVASWRVEAGGHVIALAWSGCERYLAAALADGPIVLLDVEELRVIREWRGHAGGTSWVEWRPGLKPLLASCGHDGVLRLWDAAQAEPLWEGPAGASWVGKLAWSPTGRYLALGAGKRVRLWELDETLREARVWAEQPSTIADLAWRPLQAGTEETLVSCGYNGLALWQPELEEAARKYDWKGSMLKLAWSPDGKVIATGNQDATVQFWILATGKELQMSGYRAKIRELAWDPQCRYLATGGSATVVVWDCSGKGPSGTKPLMLDFHGRLLSQLEWEPRGPRLVSGCEEGLVAVWQPGKKDRPLATAHLGSAVTQISWRSKLAVGTDAGRVEVYPT